MIRILEELSLNGWQPLQTTFYDGWVLRFASGYTRRANSVQPLYPSTLPLDEKIAHCEAVYAERGLPAIFKLTDAMQPADLDAVLERRGYINDARTSVQMRSLSSDPIQVQQTDIRMEASVSDDWLQAFIRLNSVDPRHLPTMTAMLKCLEPNVRFFRLMREGKVAAMGLGVLERGYIGVADIVTDPEHRNRGYGEQLMLNILKWAQAQDAHTAYLQVMLDNAPARRLYEKLGYREVYQYWYRQQP